jgi:hypothetical protein
MLLSRSRALGVAVLVCLLVAADDPAPRPKDPQSSYEPRSGPGAGQKFLDKFAGDWDVAKAFYPRSGGEPARATGECHQKMIHDGRFLESSFVFEQKGTKTTGLGLIGFEPDTGKFTSVWTDSRQTRMSLRQSQDPFNGEEIVLYGRSLSADAKGPPRSRTVTRLEDDGRKIVHRQYAIDAEGKERLVMELVMTRKAEGAAPGR